MTSLFESESFAIVQIDWGTGQTGYELVDKRSADGEPAIETFLTGPLARAFEDQMALWKKNTPEQEAVEEKIVALLTTNRLPLRMH